TTWPPGRRARWIPRRVADQASSVRKTWATLPVITAASAPSAGSSAAVPCTHEAASAYGLSWATSGDARVGSMPVSSSLRLARRRQVLASAWQPGGRLGVRLVVAHVEGGAGRRDAGHLEPAPGQAHRERPGPTADVDHRAGTELLQDRLVVVQVVAFAVESV